MRSILAKEPVGAVNRPALPAAAGAAVVVRRAGRYREVLVRSECGIHVYDLGWVSSANRGSAKRNLTRDLSTPAQG
jgi:hypothetical protein